MVEAIFIRIAVHLATRLVHAFLCHLELVVVDEQLTVDMSIYSLALEVAKAKLLLF